MPPTRSSDRPTITHPANRRARSTLALLGAAGVLVVAASACQSDGRSLRPAGPTQTQSVYTPTTTTTIAPGVSTTELSKVPTIATVTTLPVAAVPLTMQLPFQDEGQIPAKYTCNGEDISPQVAWLGAPADAVEMALVVTDADANDFVHWVIAGLDPKNPLIPEGSPPVGAIEGLNGFSTPTAPVAGWRGPCPPAGSTHHYWFTLYALNQQIELPTESPAEDLIAAIESAAIASAEVTGIYAAP